MLYAVGAWGREGVGGGNAKDAKGREGERDETTDGHRYTQIDRGEAARNGAVRPGPLRGPRSPCVASVRTAVRPSAPPGSLSAPPRKKPTTNKYDGYR